MLKFLSLTAPVFVALLMSSTALADKVTLGRIATAEEVAVWDIDVRPDGQGLPEGQGTVAQGEGVFDTQCASCHGDFGDGNARGPVLVGGFDTLETEDPVKTIGSYWPYLSTAFDYIRRAMPFGAAQTLSADETYAILAYLLYLNDLMDEDGYLSRENFASFKLPNERNFVEDTRPDMPLLSGRALCMRGCKSEVKILMRASGPYVTSDDDN